MGFTPNSFGGPPGLYDDESDFYGKDILFDNALHVGSNGDYVTVDGVENLRRALLRRMLVSPGEYRLRPDYGVGLGAYVKKRFTQSVKDDLSKRIRGQVLRDVRVSKVLDLELTSSVVNNETVITLKLLVEALGKRVSSTFTITGSGGS